MADPVTSATALHPGRNRMSITTMIDHRDETNRVKLPRDHRAAGYGNLLLFVADMPFFWRHFLLRFAGRHVQAHASKPVFFIPSGPAIT